MMWGASGRAVNLFNALILGVLTMGMGLPAIASKRSDCRRFFEIALELNRKNTDPAVPKDPPISSLLEVENLKIMTYNLSSIKHEPDKYRFSPNGIREKVENGKTKGRAHVNGLATTILQENADIILFQEAEGLAEAHWFIDHKLKGRWVIVSINHPDTADRLTFIVVRRSLVPHLHAVQVRHENIALETDEDVPYGKTMFYRQIQHLMIFANGSDVPFLHLLNVHLPASFRKQAILARRAELEALGKLIENIRYEYGNDAGIIVGGDFNDDFMKSGDLRSFIREGNFFETLSVVGVGNDPKRRATNAFQDVNDLMIYNQLDGLLVSSSLKTAVLSSHVVRYLGENGNALPLPISGCEISCLPSSHRPLSATFRLSKLLKP